MVHPYDNFERLTCQAQVADQRDDYYAFDQTVFFGAKGAQLADRGTINGQEVVDLKWEGERLWHQVQAPLSGTVEMQVDADTRWVNTAVQTVFHLLDSYFERQGIAMTEDHADPANQWFILGTKQVSPAQLEEAERWVNEIIHQVRLVHIGDVSVIPCGTCHVNHTAQLQSFAILGTEKAAGGAPRS